MAELQSKPEYVEQQSQREQQRTREIEEGRRAATPILDDLAKLGVHLSSLADIPKLGNAAKDTIPILLKWLPVVSNRGVKSEIIQALSTPISKPQAAAGLIEEFKKAKSGEFDLKWSIASALEVVADDSVFQDIETLVQNKSHGRTREMLAVALGNMKNPRAVSVLIDLLKDSDVAGHAIIGLGKLRPPRARAEIEPFLNASRLWVREEAKRAMANIDRVG